MIDYKELEVIGKQTGFTHIAPLDCSTIQLLPEVRQMCANNTCHMYGKNWSCPPGCGTLEECEARVRQYTHGILVQTVGNLEDSMDVETMMETEAEHKKHFFALEEQLRAKYPTMLPIGAGCCTRCKECTYPDNPCRFPDKTFASMEAYGMLVTQVCQDNNLLRSLYHYIYQLFFTGIKAIMKKMRHRKNAV